jgi:hypothetical protein
VQGGSRKDDERSDADADLARLACAVDIGRCTPKMAEKWVIKRAEERGVRLEPDAASHLVKAVDADLGAARSELDKLAGLGGGAPGYPGTAHGAARHSSWRKPRPTGATRYSTTSRDGQPRCFPTSWINPVSPASGS